MTADDPERQYAFDDFNELSTIDPDMSVRDLIARLRSEFLLDQLRHDRKAKVVENLNWFPPFNMPVRSVMRPGENNTTLARLHIPPLVRLALALVIRDLIAPAMEATEAESLKRLKARV